MHRDRFFLSTLIVAWVGATAILSGDRPQTFRTATRQLEFEVLTITASEPGTYGRRGWQNDLVVVNNASVETLMLEAYGFRPWEIVGAPEWTSTERYDVTGKLRSSPGPFVPGERAEVVKAILAQRFGMRAHSEQQDRPTYSLVLRRAPQLGPQLRRYDLDCTAYVTGDPGSSLVTQAPQPSNGVKPCGLWPGPGQIVSGSMSMAVLASRLSDLVRQVVVDTTGLNGYYELTLRYPPSAEGTRPEGRAAIQSALEEQLGLTLEPARRKLQVLVIDRIRRPALDVSEREGKR